MKIINANTTIENIHRLRCEKCHNGIVNVIIYKDKNTTTIDVRICSYCGHQYLVKQTLKLKTIFENGQFSLSKQLEK
jgi:rRNA maturation endonuclease Nob1